MKKNFSIIVYSFILVLFGGLGFFLWISGDKPNIDKVTFSLIGPRENINGENITVYAEIKNEQKIEIKNASIEFRFSDGFTFSTSTIPCAVFEHGCTVSIDAIAPHDSLRIGLTGLTLSKKQIIVSGNLEFSIKDISSLFKKYATHEINMTPSLTVE